MVLAKRKVVDLKVTELKNELEKRCADTKGLKGILQKRLLNILEEEGITSGELVVDTVVTPGKKSQKLTLRENSLSQDSQSSKASGDADSSKEDERKTDENEEGADEEDDNKKDEEETPSQQPDGDDEHNVFSRFSTITQDSEDETANPSTNDETENAVTHPINLIFLNSGNQLTMFNEIKQSLRSKFKMSPPKYTTTELTHTSIKHQIFSTTCTIHVKHEDGDDITITEHSHGLSRKAAKENCQGLVNKKIMDFVAKNENAPNGAPKRKKDGYSTKPSNSKSTKTKRKSTMTKSSRTKQYITAPKNGGYLGKGGFSKVFCVVKKGKEKELLALKVPLYKEHDEYGIDDEEVENFDNELNLHKKAQENKYVAKILDVASLQNRRAFVMEYCPRGTLEDLTKLESNISPSLIFRIHLEIVNALNFLHGDESYDKRITHNDLKPSNVLLTETFNARLTDFGGSARETQTTKRTDSYKPVEKGINTDFYLSPERAQNQKGFSAKRNDVYSFGVCLYASLCKPDKQRPFRVQFKNDERATTEDIRDRIHKLEKSKNIRDAGILYEMFKIIRSCCRENPKHSPTAEDVYYKMQSYYIDNEVGQNVLKAEDNLAKKHPLKKFTFDRTWVNVEELEL